MLTLLILLTGLFSKDVLGLQIISENPTLFGDSPHWCQRRQSLYYVDFFGVKYDILRYDYLAGKAYAAKIENSPTNAAFIIPIEGFLNEFAVGFADRTVKIVSWNGKSDRARIVRIIFKVEQEEFYKENIWHVGKTDPLGRLCGGTMRTQLCTFSAPPSGSFYCYTRKGVQKLFDDVELSNGVTWSVRKRKMYHINACEFAVKSFDWNILTGKISNSRKLYQVFQGKGIPTYTGLGLTIDTNDNLYVARYNESSVVKINPDTSKVLRTFQLPTRVVNNIAFGGPEMNELFVTSAQLSFDLFTAQLTDEAKTSTAGFLFIIKDVDATGYAGIDLRL